ncbi:hypothetical protein DFP92_101825 [Yoonia sediminilitoris]|uniref:Uncharacterized protein n=2 Tax=Yoonia sediminilitoris TaxID=1286148 RepID=A0A2T6KRP4_9RHOB|nr:hypothetical protein C8N45_101825 [Yoonia sediminilitoris]RCW99398.1 hypothetical protein DFP92_101825 [Yoonia sediminilitoris]
MGNGLEHCNATLDDEGLTLSGVVAGARETEYGAYYVVRTDTMFHTSEVRVQYIGGPVLHIEANGEGEWYDLLADAPLPDLKGCIDVDIGVTPATNTLPIKRLGLKPGESCDIVAAYVPLPSQVTGTFTPTAARQRYTCIEMGQTYRYEGLFRGFTAELQIDAFGLVLDYPETFRRV